MTLLPCILCIIIGFIVKINSFYIDDGSHANMTLNNFAFGSCYGGFLKSRSDIFDIVLKRDSDLWLWLGDATYLDRFTFNYLKKDFGFDAEHVQKMFNETKYDECIYFINT